MEETQQNRCLTLELGMEACPVCGMICFLVFRIPNDGQTANRKCFVHAACLSLLATSGVTGHRDNMIVLMEMTGDYRATPSPLPVMLHSPTPDL
jgi:hypothetical protein